MSEEKRNPKMLESLLVSEILMTPVFRVTWLNWSHRFVCDVASLLVILLVMEGG